MPFNAGSASWRQLNQVPLHIWYKCSDYRHGISVMRLRRISFASFPSPRDPWPQMSLRFLSWHILFFPLHQTISHQLCLRCTLFFAKPGRDDVMMAIAYNAAASCRCAEPILSWGMTSAAGGARREHLPHDLVSRKQVWSGASRCAADASSLPVVGETCSAAATSGPHKRASVLKEQNNQHRRLTRRDTTPMRQRQLPVPVCGELARAAAAAASELQQSRWLSDEGL